MDRKQHSWLQALALYQVLAAIEAGGTGRMEKRTGQAVLIDAIGEQT